MPDIRKLTVAAIFGALIASAAAAQDEGAAPDESIAPEPPSEEAPAATPEAEAEASEAEATDAEPDDAAGPDALGLSMGVEEAQVGQTYIAAEHGDWEQRCVRTEDGEDPCQLYQLLQDSSGNSVAEISVFPLTNAGEAVAGATIVTPLETLLTAQVGLSVDDGGVRRYPFAFCSSIGCISRVGFTQEDVNSFRRGRQAVLTIRPVAAPDQTVELTVSLNGFTAGYDAVQSANSD